MSLETFLNGQINASSQSRAEMYMEAMDSDSDEMRAAGLGGLVAISMSLDVRYEDFVILTECKVDDDVLQELVTQYYTSLGYTVSGNCHAWVDVMKIKKTGETTKRITVTNDSGDACRVIGMKGSIYVTVSDWPYDD